MNEEKEIKEKIIRPDEYAEWVECINPEYNHQFCILTEKKCSPLGRCNKCDIPQKNKQHPLY